MKDLQPVYVSDFIEEVFYDISEVRSCVREHVSKLLCRKDDEINRYIVDRLRYFGGKCMGYPSIWFISRSLDLDRKKLLHYLEDSSASLIFSLSTSIMDDLFDGEMQGKSIADVIIFYYMMMYLIDDLKDDGFSRKKIMDTVKLVAESLVILKKKENKKIKNLDINHISTINSDKIGLFYECIASCLLKSYAISSEKKAMLIELVKSFGRWCAEVDDALDVIDDLEMNVCTTYPVLLYKEISQNYPAENKKIILEMVKYKTANRLREKLKNIAHRLQLIKCKKFSDFLYERSNYFYEKVLILMTYQIRRKM